MNNKFFAAAAVCLVVVIAVLSFLSSQGNLEGRFQSVPLPAVTEKVKAEPNLAVHAAPLETEVTLKESEAKEAVIGRWELVYEEGENLCTHFEFVLKKGEDSLYLANLFADAEVTIQDERGSEVGRLDPDFNSSLSAFGTNGIFSDIEYESYPDPESTSTTYVVELRATPKKSGIASYLAVDSVEMVAACASPVQVSGGVKLNLQH